MRTLRLTQSTASWLNRGALLLALTLMLAFGVRPAAADSWEVDKAASRIGFVASYDGITFPGTFKQWQATIKFNPKQLARSKLDVQVNMASVDTNSKDRDEGIRSSEWFNAGRFANAAYTSDRITAKGGGQFEVAARFSIKGKEHPLRSGFKWTSTGPDSARLKGAVNVDRRTFNIGEGEWATDPIIGFKVKIEYDLVLKKAR